MKLVILGSSSQGNGYLLTSSDGETLVIECGIRAKEMKRALNFNISKVVGCLVSHMHGDHANFIMSYAQLGLNVFIGAESLFSTVFMQHRAIGRSRIKPIEAKKDFMVGSFKVMPFDVEHDVPCMGFLISHPEMGTTVFITDTTHCNYVFPNLNHIIVEANYSEEIIDNRMYSGAGMPMLRDRVVGSHMSFETTKELLRANDLTNVRSIILIHLSDNNSDCEKFVRETREMTGKSVYAATNGMEIPLNKQPF